MQAVDIFNSGSNEIDENIAAVSGTNYMFTIPSGSNTSISQVERTDELILIGKESPQMSVSCSFINGAFNELGKVAITSDVVTCDVVGDPVSKTRLSFIVTTDRGNFFLL